MTIPSGAPETRPGWYEDPEGTGKDRWWNGSTWTDRLHKAPRRSMYWPAFERSMRSGLNRWARVGSLTGQVGLLLFLLFFLASALLHNQLTHTAAVGLLGFLVLSVALGATAIVYGSIGITRSAIFGGLGACIHAICAGGAALLLSGFVLVVALTR